MIHTGDCLDVMATLDAESIDAIVTDPPYGLEFMGKAWDKLGDGWRTAGGFSKPGIGDRPTAWTSFGAGDTANATCATCGGRMRGAKKCACFEPVWMVKGAPLTDPRRAQAGRMQAWHEAWAREAFRVAKPSTYLLAFGGTRTVHRMTSAIEDAGWIIRDMLVWAYASGFPKSKASLKPAWEPIVMARKPGPLRMLNIDATRIGVDEGQGGGAKGTSGFAAGYEHGDGFTPSGVGRWPANVILTDPIFDGGIEGVVGGGETAGAFAPVKRGHDGSSNGIFGDFAQKGDDGATFYGDSGTYSRFFLVPKAARSDREPVLTPDWYEGTGRANGHPTVKPVDLMRHLVRLVTPPGGTVLDPFLGSGTTALACEMEGFGWVGIEKEAEYVAIAEARLNGVQRGMGLTA